MLGWIVNSCTMKTPHHLTLYLINNNKKTWKLNHISN